MDLNHNLIRPEPSQVEVPKSDVWTEWASQQLRGGEFFQRREKGLALIILMLSRRSLVATPATANWRLLKDRRGW